MHDQTADNIKMLKFKAPIEIIGINPFVFLPDPILTAIFEQAGKNKGAIPVKGLVNGKAYTQTLVKYSGFWRLYINMIMLKNSPGRIGETIEVTIGFDPVDRTITPHPKLMKALDQNREAKAVFERISPSLRKEIVRYISNLKTEVSIDQNVVKAIDFLLGKGRFVGRDHP
jgi:hypothetical protein